MPSTWWTVSTHEAGEDTLDTLRVFRYIQRNSRDRR